MTERTKLHLLRHGEVHNPSKVLYGRLPGYRLSDLGEQMARVAAQSLAGRDVTYLVSSPLERAQQTAEPFAEAFGLPVATDDRLIESENTFEGTTIEWGPHALLKPALWPKLYNPFKPSWGEPYVEIAARMRAAVDDVRTKAAGHEAVVVSHQLPIWILRRALEGRHLWHRPDHRQCALASLTTLEYDDDQLVGIRYTEPFGPTATPGPPGA